MYTVTFYSYKGGVGRTLALVNIAAELARRGRTVLVVDFDLEAPGLQSFELFDYGSNGPGIVDYVSSFIASGQAPDVADFLHPASGSSEEAKKIWVMSAGQPTSSYAEKLASIDWQDLYARRDGYLLFEDLKAQWKAAINPDYVLVDSRTGHTDVGGICTRQLPDAVVAMLLPTAQNIGGLAQVVSDIRAEASPPRSKTIGIHFVLSNVPDIDDEDSILERQVKVASLKLKFEKPSATIHHYSSLSLLDQEIFTIDRSRSRLAAEYRDLANAIISGNLGDRDGVLGWLKSAVSGRRQIEELNDSLTNIVSEHHQDGEILAAVGHLRVGFGEYEVAVDLFDAAERLGYRNPEMHLDRANACLVLARYAESATSLHAVLESGSADFRQVVLAMKNLLRLSQSDQSVVTPDRVRSFVAIERLTEQERLNLATTLLSEGRADLAAEVGKTLQLEGVPWSAVEGSAVRTLSLFMIGLGEFEKAKRLISAVRPTHGTDIGSIFNYAMAEWADSKAPPIDLFARVVGLEKATGDERVDDPNYSQCLAIALHFAGMDDEARIRLDRSRDVQTRQPGTVFSAWRYNRVGTRVFLEDLESIRRLVGGEDIQPIFFHRAISLLEPRSQ